MKKTKIQKTRFGIEKNGYNIDEVEDFLNNENEKKSSIFSEQKNKIAELKAKVYYLENQIKEFKEKENDIKNSLLLANEKAEEMTSNLKIQCLLEIERLKLFQAKWTNAYEELKERYHFSKDALNMESIVISTQTELENMLAKDFSLTKTSACNEIEKQFKNEVQRIGGNQADMSILFDKLKSELKYNSTKNVVEENVNQYAENSASSNMAFDFDEALNPKETLENICQSLGLSRKKE